MSDGRALADEVWDLHLAFVEASGADSTVYNAEPDTVTLIREYAHVHEEELAFDLILACGSPSLPLWLRARSLNVGQRLAPAGATLHEVEAYVDGWLAWTPRSDMEPPFWT